MNTVQKKQSHSSSEPDTSQWAILTHRVEHQYAGTRVDSFLKIKYPSFSRTKLKEFIQNGNATIDSRKVKPSRKLLYGEEVVLRIPKRDDEPEVNFNYSIIYEDDNIMIINKPPNLPVHPAGRFYFNTLLVHLHTNGGRYPWTGVDRFYLAHRIDKDTSGILLFGKSPVDCDLLMKQFRETTIRKEYLAIVHGKTPKQFTVDAPLRKETEGELSLKMTTRNGTLVSRTDFETISGNEEFSFVKCFPKTGRQHQIRVHLSHAGHPIYGDKIYCESDDRELIPRHALHACKISFDHPITGKKTIIEADMPPDMSKLLDFLENK